jgi:hypothetical protein
MFMKMEQLVNTKVFSMKSIPIVALLILLGSFQKRELSSNISFDKFCNEMRLFMKQCREESVQSGKYNVYLAMFADPADLGACVTMEYIFSNNQYVPELKSFHHFTTIDSNLVLMKFDQYFVERHDFKDDRIKSLKDTSIVTTRLYKGSFFGDGSASMVCFGYDDVSRKTYLNDSYVPNQMKIFNISTKGSLRVIDSTEFKKKRN